MMKNNIKIMDKKANEPAEKPYDYFDFIAISFVILLLMIDFLPNFESIDIIAPQYVYLSVWNVSLAILYFFQPKFLKINGLQILKKTLWTKCYLLFVMISGFSFFWANNASLALVAFSKQLIILILIFHLFILLYKRLHLIFIISFLFCCSVFAQTFFDLIAILKAPSITDAIANLKGNTGNINVFGASLNFKIPFLIIGVLYFSNWKKWFFVLGIFLATLTVFLSGSRATFIALLLVLIISLCFYFKNKIQNEYRFSKIIMIFLPIIIAFFISSSLSDNTSQNSRNQSVAKRLFQTDLHKNSKDVSTNQRLIFWNIATKMIAQNSLCGVGIGNWKVASIPFERESIDQASASGNTHNDFLEIMTETGILNGILYVFIFGLLLFQNLKNTFQKQSEKDNYITFLALLLLICYGVDAFFNFPQFRPTMQLCFAFMIVLTILNYNYAASDIYAKKANFYIFSIIIISITTTYISFHVLKAYQLEYARKSDLLKPLNQQLLSSTYILKNLPDFPTVMTNSQTFNELLGIYYFQEKKYDLAQKQFDISNKINPYFGRSEWFKFRISDAKKQSDSAYFYAKKAFEIKPRNHDFFVSALYAANLKNDTLEMLNLHKAHTQFVQKASNWYETSSVLRLSNYKITKIVSFVEEGLRYFPNDSALIARKRTLLEEISPTKKQPSIIIEFQKMNQKATLLFNNLQFSKALNLFQLALKMSPENPEVLTNIAVCHIKLNQPRLAIQYLLQNLKIVNSTDGKTEYLLGVCYLTMKDKENSCKFLNLSKSKNNTSASALHQQNCK